MTSYNILNIEGKTVNVSNIDHGLQKSEHNNQNHDISFDRVKPIKDET